MSNVLSTAGLVAIIINSLIVVRYGRRRVLLMTGLIGCGLLQLIIAIVYQRQPGRPSTGKVIVGLSCVYMMLYNGMIVSCLFPLSNNDPTTQHSQATYAWLSGGEIPSQRLRSHTFGLAAAVGFAFAWLTTFTTPYFINPDALAWGPRYGFIWFPSCLVAATWVYFFLPEVKNRTLEEVTEMVSSVPGSVPVSALADIRDSSRRVSRLESLGLLRRDRSYLLRMMRSSVARALRRL